MKKSLFLLSFLSFFFFQKADAQMSYVLGTSYTPTIPLNCSDLMWTTTVQNNCNNFAYNGTSHTVTGFTIEVNIDYTVGLICLGAIQQVQYTYNIGMLPPGVYTVATNSILNAVIQTTNISSVTVTTCCTAIASYTSNKSFGCEADVDSFTFTNTSVSTSNEWYLDGVLSATTTNFTTAINTAGTYNVQLITADATCSDSITQTFEVYANPLVNLGSDVNTCLGETELLSAPTGYPNYLWNTGSNAEFIWVTNEANYYVTVQSAVGCFTTDSNYVTYHSLPTPNLGNDTSVCQGETVTLDAGPYSAYSWNPFANTQTIDVTSSFPYSVNVTDVNGCEGSDTLVVTINSAPIISFPNDTVKICTGETATLMSPGTFDSYEWSTTETSTSIDVTAESNYTLTVTSNMCSNSDNVYVKIIPLPIVDLGMDTVQNCEGSSVFLEAGNTFTSYLWNTMETSSSISATTQGTYSVTVSNDQNCIGTDEVFVNVNALPIVDLGEDQDLCTNEKITLDAGSFSSYLWDNASTNASLELVGADLTTGVKTVSLEVTDENACVGSDEIVITVVDCENAISSIDLENNISVNPNPARNFIILSSEKYNSFQVAIYSTLGELVIEIENLNTSNKIDISKLNKGIYFMNIMVDNKLMVKQFVKTK
jgi:hypothetical protein